MATTAPTTTTTTSQKVGGFGRVGKELSAFKNGLTLSGGDLGSLAQLFFDNLSTLLGALFAVQGLTNMGDISVSQATMDEYIWGKIVPGVGITLVVGNVYYSWQAIRLTNSFGRQYTAQPYGLNTPAAFAFVFNIIYTVFFIEGGGDAAFITGYKVALAANFITGLISIFLGIFGRLILKVVPPPALLVPIAGIGFAFLGLEQLTYSIAAPIVGYNAILWVYLGWYSGVKLGYGQYRIPEAMMVILVGCILGWMTGLNQPSETQKAAQLVRWWGPAWTAGDLFSDFALVKDYLGIVIPIGISAAATTLMCLVSAKEAGDPYPVRETMITDGIGTCIASFFGSPFGTVIYIGHPVHKRNGARVGYSLCNGLIYCFFSWFGLLALIQSLVNQATIGPIVFFVGLMVNEEALNFMPSRHYGAYIIGLFPSIYDWVTNVADRPSLGQEFNINSTKSPAWSGVLAWKRGSLLVSMLWVAMLVNVLDRQWKSAGIWAIVAILFATFGIIHVPEAGFENFTQPTTEQCYNSAQPGEEPVVVCWEFGEQWMFVVAYVMMFGTFVLLHFAAKYDTAIQVPIDDESRHAFDDWFKDAAYATDHEGHRIGGGPHAADVDAEPTVHKQYYSEDEESDDAKKPTPAKVEDKKEVHEEEFDA